MSELQVSPGVDFEKKGTTTKRVALATIAWLLLLVALSAWLEGPVFGLVFAGAGAITNLLNLRWLRRWERRQGGRIVQPRSWGLWLRDLQYVPASTLPPRPTTG